MQPKKGFCGFLLIENFGFFLIKKYPTRPRTRAVLPIEKARPGPTRLGGIFKKNKNRVRNTERRK
jgi:hypothetical protein